MPIYEFECPKHGIIERIFPLKLANIIECFCMVDNCKLMAQKVWSLPGNIQIGQPTKMFINTKTGEPFAPMSRYDKPPKGYKEVELRNPIERAKFEKAQQQRVDAQNQVTSHVLDSMKSEARKNRHDNLNARMNAIQREEFVDKDGKTRVEEFTLDHKDKELIKKAMNRNKQKDRKEKKSNVMIAANHYDNNNLDEIK